MHVGFKGVMNEIFLRDLAKKTRRGQLDAVNSGRSAGGHCYRYDILNGETAGIYQINKDQAQIVRRIMQDYVAGHSPRTIASELNAEGVEAPRGGGNGALRR